MFRMSEFSIFLQYANFESVFIAANNIKTHTKKQTNKKQTNRENRLKINITPYEEIFY